MGKLRLWILFLLGEFLSWQAQFLPPNTLYLRGKTFECCKDQTQASKHHKRMFYPFHHGLSGKVIPSCFTQPRIRLVPHSLLVLGWLRDIISWSYLASVEFVGLSVLGHFRQHRRWDVLVWKLLKLIYLLPKCLGLGNQWWQCCRPGSCDLAFLKGNQ